MRSLPFASEPSKLPIMTKMTYPQVRTSNLRANFTDTVNRVAYGHERVLLSRRGKAIAAVAPLDDLERLDALEDAEDNRIADRMEKSIKSGKVKTISAKKLLAELSR